MPNQEYFFEMREFGPFVTENREHMAIPGNFMLAFAIQEPRQ